MNYHQMQNKELREELKKRGLKGYSSLKKIQMIEYLSTGIHPLKNTHVSPKIVEGEIRDPSSEDIGYSPTLFGGTEKLPVNQIVSGDCINVMQSFPDGIFDCCITDPPFNISRKKGLGWGL